MDDKRQSLEERIQQFVDGRLDEAGRRALDEELAANPDARDQLEALRWLKDAGRQALADVEAPQDLVEGIRDRLDREDDRGRRFPYLRWAVAAMILGAAILGIVATRTSKPGPSDLLPTTVADAMHAYHEGRLPLGIRSANGAEIEAYFAEQGIEFPTRVFDLQMMEYELVGGTPHAVSGRRSAAFAYAGPRGIQILCQMYLGTLETLPRADDVRERAGIKFYSFKRNCVSMTFWREGNVICVMASMTDLEELLALAFAKAVKG